MKLSTKGVTLCALLIALSFVLSNIKIMGSIAFDSLPAFLAGLFIAENNCKHAYQRGIPGAVIGAVGHMLTAFLSGFPFTLPIHLIVAAMMAITVFLFSLTYHGLSKRTNGKVAVVCATIVGILLNGPFSVLVLYTFLVSSMGEGAILSFTAILSVAAFANIVLAFVLFFVLGKTKLVKGMLQ